MIQDTLTLIIVLAAAIHLLFAMLKQRSGCGSGCGHCEPLPMPSRKDLPMA